MKPVRISRRALLPFLVLAACADDRGVPSGPLPPSIPALSHGSEGRGDFHRYVAIGTSVSMGVQSDGVYEATQRTAWPAQLAALAHRDLPLPLIQSPGCQAPLVPPIAANRRLSGEPASGSTVCAPNVDGVELSTGNVAIAAALTSDALSKTPETATPADYAGGRIYSRVLAPGHSQVTAMLAQKPKVVSVELGANELLKARSGLVIPGVTVVPYAAWERAYDGVIAAVQESQARRVLLVGLIDDAASFPAFRFGAEMWSARQEFAQFYVRVSEDCAGSENLLLVPVKVPTAVGQGAAAARAGQPMPVLSCADAPGTVDYVVTPADRAALNAQLRAMNARIRAIAGANGYAYFDLDALFSVPGLKAPFSVAGLMLSPTPYGQYVSLDGFHPTAAGHAVLAEAAARALNATYDMGIPLHPVVASLSSADDAGIFAASADVTGISAASAEGDAFAAEFGPADVAPAASGVSQSASGHGNLTVNGQFRTFSFTAVRHRDGEVTGQFELHNHVTGVRLHGRVTCFFAFARPLDPSRGAVFAGGVVTHTDGTVPDGTPVIFNAFDNGEGKNALFPDFLSLLLPTTPQAVQRQCTNGIPIMPVLPIEGGNIQIRP